VAGQLPHDPDVRVLRTGRQAGELHVLDHAFEQHGPVNGAVVRATNEAIALSPEHDRILKRVKLPGGHGRWLGWWDGNLAVTQGGPPKNDAKRLLQIDPEDGRVRQEVSLRGGVLRSLPLPGSLLGWLSTR